MEFFHFWGLIFPSWILILWHRFFKFYFFFEKVLLFVLVGRKEVLIIFRGKRQQCFILRNLAACGHITNFCCAAGITGNPALVYASHVFNILTGHHRPDQFTSVTTKMFKLLSKTWILLLTLALISTLAPIGNLFYFNLYFQKIS